MSLSLYPIIKELSDGGFGKTYLAINTLLPARPYCVVKQLKPVNSDPKLQKLIQERFEKEAIILKELSDESNGTIPRLYAYFIEENEFYLVQEYVDGQTLSDRVRSQGIFTEQQVRDWLMNILSTLTYVHSRGIIHRDIKPDNIMLRQRDNKPILIDFGAVKETMSTIVTNSGNSSRSIVIGTPGFMPIEQMAGRPMFASDIYSLGLTAIYLLTGKMPAEMETDPATGNANWQPHIVNISPQLIGILNKATQTLLNARYANAQEMLQALNSGHQQPTTVQNQPSSTMLSPSPTRDPHPQGIHTPTQPQFDQSKLKGSNDSSRAVIMGAGVGSALLILGLLLGKNIMGTDANRNIDRQPEKIAASNDGKTIAPMAPPPDRSYATQPSANSASEDYTWLSQRLVSNADLQGKTGYDLDIMRNSIFARYGRRFRTPGIQAYFDRQSWYQPKYSSSQFPTNLLSVIEHKNTSYIDNYQTRFNLRYFQQ